MTVPNRQHETPSLSAALQRFIVQLSILAVTGTLTTSVVLGEAQPVLVLVAGTGGGAAASALFVRLRSHAGLRRWVQAHWHAHGARHILAAALGYAVYHTATAAISVAVLGAVFSGAASLALALIAGTSWQQAWAACVAFLVSQCVYMVQHGGRHLVTPHDA